MWIYIPDGFCSYPVWKVLLERSWERSQVWCRGVGGSPQKTSSHQPHPNRKASHQFPDIFSVLVCGDSPRGSYLAICLLSPLGSDQGWLWTEGWQPGSSCTS